MKPKAIFPNFGLGQPGVKRGLDLLIAWGAIPMRDGGMGRGSGWERNRQTCGKHGNEQNPSEKKAHDTSPLLGLETS
jgi:hypothetical protein